VQSHNKRTSVQRYLAAEQHGELRHEYVDGELYAMSGASRRHNLIVTNLLRHAANAAAASGTRQVFGGSMKVRVPAHNSFYYPDVSVCCDPSDRAEQYLERPCLLIEVSSPSTVAIDRREKRLSYSTLQSLHEYLIVEQDRVRVTVYPGDGSPWSSRTLDAPEDRLELSCLGLTLTMRDVYEGVMFPAPGVCEPENPNYDVA